MRVDNDGSSAPRVLQQLTLCEDERKRLTFRPDCDLGRSSEDELAKYSVECTCTLWNTYTIMLRSTEARERSNKSGCTTASKMRGPGACRVASRNTTGQVGGRALLVQKANWISRQTIMPRPDSFGVPSLLSPIVKNRSFSLRIRLVQTTG